LTSTGADQSSPLDVGVAAAPLPGETESGDVFVVRPIPNGCVVAVIDGLGHGHQAAAAARRAAAVLVEHASHSVIALARHCHQALRGTRGVVMSLATFNLAEDTMSWLGIGNVEGVLLRADRRAVPRQESILVRGGVVGLQLPLLNASVTSIAPGDLVAFATDGVRKNFVERLNGTFSPQRMAEQILAECSKGTDDALVLVGRYKGRTSWP
jgi:hypothetical protein